ncbi:MAG: glutamine amidotransferase, partial [Pseudomonadota bacterium]
MCGIVGLFLKDKSLEPKLGAMLTDMLITMSDRGPDSAGIAVYGEDHEGRAKLTLQAADPGVFAGLASEIEDESGVAVKVRVIDTHEMRIIDTSNTRK